MKQYKIIASSKELEDFEIQIFAHENILFSELHQGIQAALEYDPLQMASFFMSNENWEKEDEIALIDMEDNGETLLMDELKLSNQLYKKGQNLLYLFDFFSERLFFMTVKEIIETDEKIFSIDIKGNIPLQINIDNESIDELMLDIEAPPSKQDSVDNFDDEYGNDNISFENIDDLEDF